MFPIKLALVFTRLATQYGPLILHSGNADLLTKDLGDALRRQKKIITDPDMGALETASEALPVIAEVKLLTMAVSRKMGIDTSGKSTIAVLEEIVKQTEASKSTSANEIKNTLDWTRAFFAHPEIQEILKADMIQIERPDSLRGIGRSFLQSSGRLAQEFSRLQDFLVKAKAMPEVKPKPVSKPRNRKKPGPGPSN